jgi:hypothetical protein
MDGTAGAVRDFFISRAGEDKDVALLIDEILREAGYSTFIQDRDFGATAFTARMDEGFRMVEAGARIVALLSRAYQAKEHCLVEARYPLTDDPTNSRQRLIVLRIEECAPVGFLKPIRYVDLVPIARDAAAVRKAVLGAVDPDRDREAADFAALYRRSGGQVIHPEVRPVPGFTARGEEWTALETALWQGSGRAALTAAAAAVKGLGGVGKSVLAKQYAWMSRERYEGVWWLRAETRETLLDDLIALGSRFIDKIAEMPDRARRRGSCSTTSPRRAGRSPGSSSTTTSRAPAPSTGSRRPAAPMCSSPPAGRTGTAAPRRSRSTCFRPRWRCGSCSTPPGAATPRGRAGWRRRWGICRWRSTMRRPTCAAPASISPPTRRSRRGSCARRRGTSTTARRCSPPSRSPSTRRRRPAPRRPS